MNIEAFREYCLSFKEVTEDFPFDDRILAFKVAGKIFALTDVDDHVSINLKCNPERAIMLREQYEEVQPGYHMNKKHWNTVMLFGKVDEELLKELIRHSYECVVAGMPKKYRVRLGY